jgi:predicted dehydrogenase
VPTLRAAIVGSGFISTKKHIPAFLRQRERVQLAAIADLNAAAASEAAARFNIPRVYTDVSEMLARERVDLVDICTPPPAHASVALQALERGCHVLIEKPMAVTTRECDQIIDAARARGAKVSVAHSDLFYPPFMRARRMVGRGAIGDFMGMRIFLSTPTDYMTSQPNHWAHKLPGGVIGESGPHAVYLTLAFINPIERVTVQASKHLAFPWSRFDDYRIELIGEKSASSIASVYTSDQWAAEVDIWGTRGMLKLDLELMSLVRHDRRDLSAGKVARSGLAESLALVKDTARTGLSVLARRYKNTHDILIEGFIDSILRDTPPPVTGEDGREAVRVMNLIAEQLGNNAGS